MRNWAVSLLCAALAACATAPPPPASESVFEDRLFAAPSERISAADVFALSDDMKRYLDTEVAPGRTRRQGGRQALLDALYSHDQLKLEYDSVMTRNAAQAFADRTGNCLSLVIMTGAIAKAMGLPVRYQVVSADDTLGRSGDMQFFIGHVNLTLGDKPTELGPGRYRPDLMTIDFVPSRESAFGVSVHSSGEETIVAMFMNNRAAEALARGKVDNAYWWARAAIRSDPRFTSAYNTLGVIYLRHGDLAPAQRTLAFALEREPRNTHVMANLVGVLKAMGRTAEAKDLSAKLEQLDPNPPFSAFNRGVQAMREGNYKEARDLFAKEVDRAPYYHEFRFWLAQAYAGLGDVDQARRQLGLAMEYSTTGREHDMYAAKLDRIRATHLQ